MKLSANFDLEEFSSPDANYFPISVLNQLQKLVIDLQFIRDHIDSPISINSGWRTESHNYKVGAVRNSQHLLGKAADITAKGLTATELYDIILTLEKKNRLSPGGLGIYDTFVHYDIREGKSRWDDRSKIV